MFQNQVSRSGAHKKWWNGSHRLGSLAVVATVIVAVHTIRIILKPSDRLTAEAVAEVIHDGNSTYGKLTDSSVTLPQSAVSDLLFSDKKGDAADSPQHNPKNFDETTSQSTMHESANEYDYSNEQQEQLQQQQATKSPYEVRAPHDRLPSWARKSNVQNNTVPPEEQLCFVHVGKTAGSTIGCALGFHLHCAKEAYIDSAVSHFTTHVAHNGVNDCPFDTKHYLLAVRDPLSRMRSVHVYERPSEYGYNNNEKNRFKLYEDCPFTTLNDLAEQGLSQTGNASEVCKRRAYNHVRGIQQFGYHAFYNYHYYYHHNMVITEETKVYVVRTEHLVEDWNVVERMLGGTTQVQDFGHFNPSTKKTVPGDEYLSIEARRLLCEALCKEIQLYKKLLQDAVNLREADVNVSLQELEMTCPLEARLQECPVDTAYIPLVEQSPYEIRSPGHSLPQWAQKAHSLLPVNGTMPSKEKEICFVHVGETAGSTLECALGFQCSKDFYVDGTLSRYTTHLFHKLINDCPEGATNYLISVRHPLDRIQSIHVYERSTLQTARKGSRRGMIYEECPFWTLDKLAANGLSPNGKASEVCKERAYTYIRGIEQFGYHAYYNYHYYHRHLDNILNNTTNIYVVRKEHMMLDWTTIENMLDGEHAVKVDFQHINPSTNLTVAGDKYLSSESRRLLCEALCEEIQVYKTLLQRAVNLDENMVATSLDELAVTCPVETDASTCG